MNYLFVFLWISTCIAVACACPPRCTCTTMRSRESPISQGRKVVCAGMPNAQFRSLEEIRLTSLPLDTLQLSLKGNQLTIIKHGAFKGLNALQKLDLSKNKIAVIEPGAFLGLDNLERLDLSENALGNINASMFTGLGKVTRVSLSKNQLKTIAEGSFQELASLKKIDFQSNLLMCDCHIQWIIKWSKSNVRISDNTKCAFPRDLAKRPLRSMKRKDLHCNWPIELPLFVINPSKSQVVFQGDELPFECRASAINAKTDVVWFREGKKVETNQSAGIMVSTRPSDNNKVIMNRLTLRNLEVKNSGIWMCQVQTPQGNASKTVNIVVISDNTLHCPRTEVQTNRGWFKWPKTVSGVSIEHVCETGRSASYHGKAVPKAYYTCSAAGKWENLDTMQCQYMMEMTRVLEQYSMLQLNHSNVYGKAVGLRQYIGNGYSLQDKLDVVYISDIIGKLSVFVSTNQELVDVMLDVISVVMELPDSLLMDAQKTHQACSRMIQVIEHIPNILLDSKKYSSHYSKGVAFEAFKIRPESFSGMTCSVQSNPPKKLNESNFRCHDLDDKAIFDEKNPRASITLPSPLLKNMRGLYGITGPSFKVQFVVYKNAKLFPIVSSSVGSEYEARLAVMTNIISSKISEAPVENLTTPIIIRLQSAQSSSKFWPVYWDFNANNGIGGWITNGCKIIRQEGNQTEMRCSHLTNFGVMQVRGPIPLELFIMEPVVYAGSLVCVLCMMTTIASYCMCHRNIIVTKKLKHSVVNICLSILILIMVFTMGVLRTDHLLACQIIGIIIHYFSISAIFWITITTSNMYKKIAKAQRPPPPPEDFLEPIPPRPMIRFYLLGYGVTLIICGITAAVNMKHYAGRDYCFLSAELSMGALVGPVGVLLLTNIVLFICIGCALKGTNNGSLESTDTDDIELTEGATCAQTNATNDSASTTTIVDKEHRAISQMRALIILIFLYIFMWTTGALLIAKPFKFAWILPYQEMIFSYLYGFASAALGIFILVFYCLSRRDARTSWNRFLCCEPQQRMYDIQVPAQPAMQPIAHMPKPKQKMPQANGHVTQETVISGHESGSVTDKSMQSGTHNGGLNGTLPHRNGGPKQNKSNANLVASQTVTYTEPSVVSVHQVAPSHHQSGPVHHQSGNVHQPQELPVSVFYNPRQNVIANKFWERKRRHQVRRDHLQHINSKEAKTDQSQSSLDKCLTAAMESNKRHSNGTNSDICSVEIQSYFTDSIGRKASYKPGLSNISGSASSVPMDRNQMIPVGAQQPPQCSSPTERNKTPSGHTLPPTPHNQTSPGCPECHDSSPGGSLTFPPPPPPIALVTPLSGGLKMQGPPAPQICCGPECVTIMTSFSKVCDECAMKQQKQGNELPLIENLQPKRHWMQPHSKSRPHSSGSDGHKNKSHESVTDDDCHRTKFHSLDNDKDGHRNRDSFLEQIEQRIPPRRRPLSPAKSDTTHSHMADSDSQVDRRHKHRHHRHRHGDHRHRRRSGLSKQSSWEDEFKDRPRKHHAYAHVPQEHRDKSIPTGKPPYMVESGSRSSSNFPRSVSAYEQMANGLLENMDNSSSSSEDDQGMWLPKRDKRRCKKVEASLLANKKPIAPTGNSINTTV
ncbi:adhesion G protein-coupled receptor A3-like isoform X2 [Lineus longissimus]|uniref:adhesion G protein-coupled receptor A3-like isoform X2 n=1 Tax=Lineus longissimus TaxID=88925 RepID=UPI002B4E2C3E